MKAAQRGVELKSKVKFRTFYLLKIIIGVEEMIEWNTKPRYRGEHSASDFGTNRKLMCDFLLVINNNLHPILHSFQVKTDYWSNFR